MLPGCHVAEADGPAFAAATGASTVDDPAPPTWIALAVECTAPTATRAAAALRDTAAAEREPDTPTDAAGVCRVARLAAAPEGRRATPLAAVADAPRLAGPLTDDESGAVSSA